MPYPHHKEPDPQEWIKTVHTIKESEIKASGKTQCQNHTWRKLSETEIECVNCPTALIVGADNIEQYL